jgi:hypothetical protein
MAVKQLAISMDPKLVSRVRKAAKRSREGNVSAWLADAASAQLRHEEARLLLDKMVAEEGPISQTAIKQVRRQWRED